MAKIEKFEDLEIWQIAKQVGVEAYRISDLEPMKSDFGLKDQFRRAAMSMSDNVAEGFEYNNNPDFIRFLTYAKGSSGEFRNKIIIMSEAKKLSDVNFKFLYDKCIEFSSKTKRFIDYLRDFEMKKKALKKGI
ncbi:four helix bundle protein [Pedobacter sp. CFBP9032]|uniref:four helix bundle protein n=1 Tax=Pedobacter sp. CFBP9032 TaxID=3096539 RepID=UPI002A6B3EA6|nr:four helix bundle protein [Pedobacter sp. CFBP9032]MDY0906727.1 four helix bundle protein [Pedobacter sp. CFBP9032]